MYIELLKAMEDEGIRYVVVGGVAVILHGFVRASMDLDLVISLDSTNTRQFIDTGYPTGEYRASKRQFHLVTL